MSNVTLLVTRGALVLGLLAAAGCASNQGSSTATSRHPGFQGGNGAFGESTEQAGIYAEESTATHRVPADDRWRFQGGNGAFGESPESPGTYAPSRRDAR